MKKVIAIITVIFLGLTLGAAAAGLEQLEKSPNEPVDTSYEPVDTSWIPSDFNGYSKDSNIAWRWAKGKEFDCDYGSCWGIMILTKDGCSSMYAEINIFDKNDIQIDWTNESTSIIQPMQKVLLSFSTFNDSAQSASIAEFNCR